MAALVAGQLGDLLTFLVMDRAREANPFVADLTAIEATFAKTALMALTLAAGWLLAHKAQKYHGPALRTGLYQLGALAGAFGAGANVSVLLGG